MKLDHSSKIERLMQHFGDRILLTAATRELHGSSEAHHAPALPDAVFMAQSTSDVSAVVKMCADVEMPIIPFGAGTSLEGNISAVHGGLSIDLSEMNKILRVNASDLDCAVQPGVTRQQLNSFLRDQGLFFPIDPGAEATLGGMAATRASGTTAIRYGTMRDNVLTMEVVLSDGQIIRTGRRARKSSAGYDLTRLFVGSEGTLGLITELTLRLQGIPEAIASAVCHFPDIRSATNTAIAMIQFGIPVARVELLDDRAIAAVNQYSKMAHIEASTLFLEFHGSDASVKSQIEETAAIVEDYGGSSFTWHHSAEERTKLWQARHTAYYATTALRPGSKGWATDVCVPVSRLADCIVATTEMLRGCSVPSTIMGHVGDGNFHVVFAVDPQSSKERSEVDAVNKKMIDLALSMEGTCTGEHGVGSGKIAYMTAEHGAAIEVMRKVKVALDPQNILNPGKILPQG